MESRLPKPTNTKRPLGAISKAISILPMDRLKSNSTIIKNNSNSTNHLNALPLSRDLVNFGNATSTISRSRRVGSPDLISKTLNRVKLRRSKSACDIRDVVRPLKRAEPTLAPIPAKLARIGLLKNTCSTSTTIRPNMRNRNASADSILNSNISTLPSDLKKNQNAIANKTTSINKRIPPYDYKARFNDLLEKHKILKEKHEEIKTQLATYDSLPEQFEASENQVFTLTETLKNVNSEIECLQRQTDSQSVKITSLAKSLQIKTDGLEKLEVKYEKIFTEHSSLLVETKYLRENNIDLKESVEFLTHELNACKEQLFTANIERKELHNTIMDLRGNIRVFCRVRPPLNSEENRFLCTWNYLDECNLEIQSLEMLPSGQKNKNSFSFDQVFHPKSTQEDVFEMVSPLIQSALDGYNICIFAYGQTGSGKTYTMDGICNNVGVIPRTVDLLFESIENYKRMGWEYELRATFLEIYNEVLYDLLSNEQKDMEIRMANKNNKTDILVTNITEETVQSANHLRQLMSIAKMNRATASTSGNERSSRSHAVTRIELIGTHKIKEEISVGTINLVDLAGSESPKTSLRMNETKNINRSLSELTNVILALLQKQDHIPYRNSKLTHLLMPSLGGNSKTLMFINVSPFQDCYGESVKSLRFAATVNSCKMVKAKKNKFLNTSSTI